MPAGPPECQPSTMAAPDVDQLRALDLEERLVLVQELRDSIVEDAQRSAELSRSDDDRQELDARLREDDERPDAAIPWADARAQLRDLP